jgi:NAD(P)-dependent dehydrogenase (short-subunit alcohol dehydrogenase family)
VAIMTGAGSGIARAGARTLAREGAQGVVTDLRAEAAAETPALIEAEGGRGVARALDVTDAAAFAALVAETHEARGRIDILPTTPAFRWPGH